jgi:hypothetical protein
LLFQHGQLIVVSGPDLAEIYDLLLDTRDEIISTSRNCLDPVDTRTVLQYPSDIEDRAIKFEFTVLANQDKVILVGNQFDRESQTQNPEPKDLEIDVVRDLLNGTNIRVIPGLGDPSSALDSRYGFSRELFSYISRVYYFDTGTDEVFFVKTQIPFRP